MPPPRPGVVRAMPNGGYGMWLPRGAAGVFQWVDVSTEVIRTGAASAEYRPVTACLRPPRFAVAYEAGDHWVYHARQVLASMSRVWGGAGGVVLPVGDDGRPPQSLLPLLRLYDPDLIAGHVLIGADLATIDPARVARWKQDWSEQGEDPEQVLEQLRHEPLGDRQWDGIAEVVDRWCSPFKGVDQAKQSYAANMIHWLHRHRSTRRDLTLLPEPADDRILTVELGQVDPLVALMIETRIGSAAADTYQHGEVLALPMSDEDIPDLVRLAITGEPKFHRWNPNGAWAQARAHHDVSQPPALLTEDEFLAATPMVRTRRWTARVQTGEAPIVCIIGDTAEDHALAVISDRLFHHGAWVPHVLLGEIKPVERAATMAMHSLRHLPGGRDGPVLVATASAPFEEVTRIVDELNCLLPAYSKDGTPASTEPRFQAVTVDELAAEPERYFLADPVAFGVRRTVPLRDDAGELSILTPLALPLPAIAEHVDEARWCIDVLVGGYAAPARTALASRTFLQGSLGPFPEAITRAGRHGVSFGSANMGLVIGGAPPEGRLAHPLLRFPSAEQIFTELARARGATVRRSDAGRRTGNAVELWGALDAILADIKGPVRGLMAAFLPPGGKRNGSYPSGYAIRGDGYLTFSHAVEALVVTETQARATLDRLLMAKVLRRGLILSCARCRWQAFHRVEELGPSMFSCAACGHMSALTCDAWAKSEPEPVWHYSLDQVVRELQRQHGDIPLLAVDHLSRSHRAVLWSPELAVTKEYGTVELDITVVIDGRIIVGEAKSNGKLSDGKKSLTKAAARLAAAAHTLSADEIVLATATQSWSPGTRSAVEDAVDARWTLGRRPTVTEITSIGVES